MTGGWNDNWLEPITVRGGPVSRVLPAAILATPVADQQLTTSSSTDYHLQARLLKACPKRGNRLIGCDRRSQRG